MYSQDCGRPSKSIRPVALHAWHRKSSQIDTNSPRLNTSDVSSFGGARVPNDDPFTQRAGEFCPRAQRASNSGLNQQEQRTQRGGR